MILYIVFLLLALIAATIFICVRPKAKASLGLFTKALASLMFVVLASVTYGVRSWSPLIQIAGGLLILGLICGMLGDIFLDLRRVAPDDASLFLKAGIGSFALGHLCYIASLTLFSKAFTSPSWIICLILILAAVLLAFCFYLLSVKCFKLQYGPYALFAGIYSFILLFTFIYAVYIAISNPKTALFVFAAGLGLFLASDIILSLQYFGARETSKPLTIANHVLYYLAQILIASFIYFV